MKKAIKAIVCDFDGTFSTLRCGWEGVMRKMMLKYLPGEEKWIDEFIGETTGIQTILQMKGFVAELKKRGLLKKKDFPTDPWAYKNEYNDMLMASVAKKRQDVIDAHEKLLRENDKLREANQILKEELSRTDGHTFGTKARTNTRTIAARLIREYKIGLTIKK